MLDYDACLRRATACAAEADLVTLGDNRLRYLKLAAEWMARAAELNAAGKARPRAA